MFISNEDGVTVVVKAGTEFAVLAENKLEEYTSARRRSRNGQLFLRTAGHLYCIGKPRRARAN